MDHMAFEFERIFDHNSMPGKVVWIIDMKGMREWTVVIMLYVLLFIYVYEIINMC
jgi:hypothetical protein